MNGINGTIHQDSEMQVDKNEGDRYIIFEVLFDKHSPIYLPKMLMNICFKFWMADEDLQADINLLMDITSKVSDNKHVIELEQN